MPIYEYVCESCNHEFEELARSPSDRDAMKCPACESSEVARELSVFTAGQGESRPANLSPGGPCSTCSDPNGPCPLL